jgi:hypothetical protein
VTVFDIKNGTVGFGLDKGCSGASFTADVERVFVPGPREHGHKPYRPLAKQAP